MHKTASINKRRYFCISLVVCKLLLSNKRRTVRRIAAPGPPGWGLGEGPITLPCKTPLITETGGLMRNRARRGQVNKILKQISRKKSIRNSLLIIPGSKISFHLSTVQWCGWSEVVTFRSFFRSEFCEGKKLPTKII